MPRAYPTELRERAVKAYESGEETLDEVATRFEIAERSLRNWVEQKRRTGSLAPKPRGGGNFSPVDLGVLEKVLAEHRDATTDELTKAYNKARPYGRRIHRSSILRALRRQGYVFKKNARDQRSKIVRTFAPRETTSGAG